MKYAVPVSGGLMCPHFGHCEQFALIDVDEQKKVIIKTGDDPVVEPDAGKNKRKFTYLAECQSGEDGSLQGVSQDETGTAGDEAFHGYDQQEADHYKQPVIDYKLDIEKHPDRNKEEA